MKKLLITILLIISILPLNVYASKNVEIVFSETFKGDLSRWIVKYSETGLRYVEPFIEFTEYNPYISEYLLLDYLPLSDQLFAGVFSFKSIPFDIEPNCTYTVAADVKGEGRIHIKFLNSEDTVVGSESVTAYSKKEWQCFSLKAHAPAGAIKAQVGLNFKSAGELEDVCFDNVIVCKGYVGFEKDLEKRKKYAPLATDDSSVLLKDESIVLLENFENKTDKWTPINKKSELRAVPKDIRPYNGKKSLHLLDEYEDTNVGTESVQIDAVPGGKYNVSFMARHKEGEGAILSIDFLDEEGIRLASQSATVAIEKDWENYEIVAIAPDKTKFFRITAKSLKGKGENYIDNLKVTVDLSDVKEEPSEFDKLYNNSMVLLMNSPNVLVNGEKKLIDDENKNVVVCSVNSRTLVPVRFIAENFNWKVSWDGNTQTVTLKSEEKTVEIVLGKTEVKINDSVVVTDVPAQAISGRTMLPLRFFAETVMGKNVHWDNAGLIVITNEKNSYLENNKEAVNKLIKMLINNTKPIFSASVL